MTLKPIEHDTLLRVKNSLAFTNTVYLDAAMHNKVLDLWNDYNNFDPDPELLRIKRLIFFAAFNSKHFNNDYKLQFSNGEREIIMKTLLTLDLRSLTEQEVSEREVLKAGEDHNMIEVVIDDEVNFKMQISKGDKLTLEITDQGVTQVSLNAPESKGDYGKFNSYEELCASLDKQIDMFEAMMPKVYLDKLAKAAFKTYWDELDCTEKVELSEPSNWIKEN